MTIEDIIDKVKDRKYLSVEEEEEYMQEIYDSVIGDIEQYAFSTPNWIAKKEKEKEKEKENEKVEGQISHVRMSRYGRDL